MGYVGKEIDAHNKLSQLHDLCLYVYLNELKAYISIVESSNSDSEKFFVFSSSCEHAFHVLVRIKVLALTMQKCIFFIFGKKHSISPTIYTVHLVCFDFPL